MSLCRHCVAVLLEYIDWEECQQQGQKASCGRGRTQGAAVFTVYDYAGAYQGTSGKREDIVIHYNPWWNLAVQNQATDRAHRIGQKRAAGAFEK